MGGPSFNHSVKRLRASCAPQAKTCTEPSGMFLAYPVMPSGCAWRRVDSRKKTPCTRPSIRYSLHCPAVNSSSTWYVAVVDLRSVFIRSALYSSFPFSIVKSSTLEQVRPEVSGNRGLVTPAKKEQDRHVFQKKEQDRHVFGVTNGRVFFGAIPMKQTCRMWQRLFS